MSSTSAPPADDSAIAATRQRWNELAPRYTATLSKRIMLQCAREMHAHLQLGDARSVLEVAAGAGLGSLDIAQRMASSSAHAHADQQQHLLVTDLSPRMVELAAETLQHASTERLDVRVAEANGQDLKDVATGSMDRYVSNMCLMLTPDPDAMLREAKRVLTRDGIAGFTIWGRLEHTGIFAIDAAVSSELGLTDGAENPNFAMGKDLAALRQRFAAAGFSRVRIWPYLCVLSLWSGDEYAAFQEERSPIADEELRARRLEVSKRIGDEWLATKGIPIGFEAYIVIARA